MFTFFFSVLRELTWRHSSHPIAGSRTFSGILLLFWPRKNEKLCRLGVNTNKQYFRVWPHYVSLSKPARRGCDVRIGAAICNKKECLTSYIFPESCCAKFCCNLTTQSFLSSCCIFHFTRNPHKILTFSCFMTSHFVCLLFKICPLLLDHIFQFL